MHALQTQQSSTPQPAILTPLVAGTTASSVRDRTDPPRACFGVGCIYHGGCARYHACEGQHDDAPIAFCWIKGAFPLFVDVETA